MSAKPARKRRSDFVPPPNAQAAIFFTPGQYNFQWHDGGGISSKHLTPAAMRNAFVTEPVDSRWLPPGAVRWGVCPEGAFMVGFYPAAVRHLFVEFDGGRTRRLRVALPTLVFCGVASHYYVWAVRSDKFDPAAPLYNAPFPNLNRIGLICFGANSHPDVAAGGFHRSWEMLWQSPFTDHHREGRVGGRDSKDVRELLLRMHRARAKRFPPKSLVAMNTTLDAAVTRITQRGKAGGE